MRNRIFNAAWAAIFLSNSAWADNVIGGWKIEEKKNPITDIPWVIAQTQQSDASDMWLQIRCEANKPLIVLGISDADFPPKSEVKVMLRIDRLAA
jgi:hypothetical protein